MKITKRIVLTEDFFVRDENGVGYMYEPGDEIIIDAEDDTMEIEQPVEIEIDEPIYDINDPEPISVQVDSFEGSEIVTPQLEEPIVEPLPEPAEEPIIAPIEEPVEIIDSPVEEPIIDEPEDKEVLIQDPFFSDIM